MWSSTGSAMCAWPAYSASRSSRSDTEPATSAAITGGSARHLRDAVLLEDVHRLGDGLGRVGVHEVGQLPLLPRSTSPTVCSSSAAGRKPYWPSHSSLNTLVR